MTDEDAIERLSAKLHAIYQAEARRQAGTGEDTMRHPDEYDALPEHVKEYDRVLARFILRRERALLDVVNLARQQMRDMFTDDVDPDTLTSNERRLRAALSHLDAELVP